MDETNPWALVTPVRPREAELELGFLLLDVAQDESPDVAEYSKKLTDLINGLYIAGWRDCKDELYRRMLAATD